jgi:hypothetical protein
MHHPGLHIDAHWDRHAINRDILLILTIILLVALGILSYMTRVNIPDHIEFMPDFLKAPIVVLN